MGVGLATILRGLCLPTPSWNDHCGVESILKEEASLRWNGPEIVRASYYMQSVRRIMIPQTIDPHAARAVAVPHALHFPGL